MSTEHGVAGLKRILGQVSFPADKEQIVERASALGADSELLGALRAMPPVGYDQPDDVMRSVALDESDGGERTESQQAQQRRHHTKPGQAETMKETGPVNPIEEELGENRKS
ncbi:DUF2795 domain-containing protein [Nocardiopsis oceani]